MYIGVVEFEVLGRGRGEGILGASCGAVVRECLRVKVLIAYLLVSVGAGAQMSTADPAVQSACRQVAGVPLPEEMVGLAVPTIYPKCDSYALYEKKDYAGAWGCAVLERMALLARLPDSPAAARVADAADDGGDPAGGLVVLSQMYANGEGVARNAGLAARFFCEAVDTNEVQHDDAFTKDILATLERVRGMGAGLPHFELCVTTDSVTSIPPDTPPTRYCGELQEEHYAAMHAGGMEEASESAEKDAADAAAALEPELRKLTAVQRAAYGRVTAAFDGFVAKQVTGDFLFPGPRGSGGLFPDEERAALYTQVAAWLKVPPPVANPAALSGADAELNKVYRDLGAAAALANSQSHYEVTPDLLRAEQRAWLAYRDAFVAFGHTLKPGLPAGSWILPLTTARTSDLQQVYDGAGKEWIKEAQEHKAWQAQAVTRTSAEAASRRAEVAQYFDHQTPAQAAAWQRVEAALAEFTAAHNAAVPNASPIYGQKKLEELYGELYVFQYNYAHHFPVDGVKAEQGLAANEQRLNEAYQADLASDCLFKPVTADPAGVHRTVEGLRGEQRAWLKLRDAWVDFLGTLFPEQPRAAMANMFTGSRAFELRMLTDICGRTGRAPKEQ